MSSTLGPILSSLGLSAPNPAQYSDASTVANQKTAAVTGLQASISVMNTALMGATAAGAPSEYINQIKKKVADGQTLLTSASTMDPAALQKETSRLQSEFTASQFKMTQDDYNTQVADLTAMVGKVTKRNTEIQADNTTSKELLAKYNTLLKDADTALTTLLNSPPVYKTEQDLAAEAAAAGSSGSSGSAPAAYSIPVVLTPGEIQNTLDVLDDQKDQEEGSGFSIKRAYAKFKRMYTVFYTPLFYIVIVLSAFLGGIILSNAYAEVESEAVLNRLFYFIYGMIGYPAVLVYSCLPSGINPLKMWPGKTPYWVGGIFPYYMRYPVSLQVNTQATATATANANAQQEGGGVASMLASAQAKAKALAAAASEKAKATVDAVTAKAKAAAEGLVGNVSSSYTARSNLTIVKESYIKDSSGMVTSSTELQPSSLSERLLSFVIVDSKNPPPYQVTNRTTLFHYSAAALAANIFLLISNRML